MDPDALWRFGLLVVMFLASAFFSASETAIMSLSKIKVQQMVEEGKKGGKILEELTGNPSKVLTAILIGNNIVNIGASSLMTVLALDIFGSKGLAFATGLTTFIILVFGEITPKTLAAQNSDKVAIKVAGVIKVVTIVLSPLIFVFNLITKGFIILFGGDVNSAQPFITQEELMTMVSVSHQEGVLEGDERDMIYKVFEFSDSQVRDVMTPRTDMTALDVNSTRDEVMKTFREDQYSRIPIFDESIDNIVGIVFAKDLLFIDNDEDFNLKNYMREPNFTYEFYMTKQLFDEMRADRIHIAIVLNEYGGTEGLITIEDLIEEIVGEIEDEYDKEEIITVKEGEYLVSGSMRLEDLNDIIGTNIESEEFDSIGGFIIGLLERFPESGDKLECEGLIFSVESTDKNRIETIRIRKIV